LGVDCAHGQHGDKALDFKNAGSSVMPIFFLNETARESRHYHWQQIVKEEEAMWNRTAKNWVSSNSAVLGLASGYGLGVYKGTEC
jgi:hypothetical protein